MGCRINHGIMSAGVLGTRAFHVESLVSPFGSKSVYVFLGVVRELGF